MLIDKSSIILPLQRFHDYFGTPGPDFWAPGDIPTPGRGWINRVFAGGDNDIVYASEGRDWLYGEGGDDYLFGQGGNDHLDGGIGHDYLDGGAGADGMVGGTGNDWYVVDDAGDQVTENAGGGYDRVSASVNYTLAAHVEELMLTGTAHAARGNDLNNQIRANDAPNFIDGGAGGDFMVGYLGDDHYMVDNIGDFVIELAGEGRDTVTSSISYYLPANVEVLMLAPLAGAISGAGNELDNVIWGNESNNWLSGGAGNDTFYVQNYGDVVFESFGEGHDLVVSSGTDYWYMLTPNVEDLLLIGTIGGIGNELNNRIWGHASFDNVLDGGLGDDTLIGDGGADTLIGGGGVDTASYETSTAAVTANLLTPSSNLGDAAGDTYTGIANLTGGSAGDTLVGDGNANVLTGGAGADTLIGGGGGDTAGYETSTAAVTANLLTPSSNLGDAAGDTYTGVANLTGGSAGDTLTGDGNANVLRGNAGSDRLDGGAGVDRLIGGAGADEFQFRSPADSGAAGAAPDVIADFLSHRYAMDADTIDLSAIDANTNIAGDQAFVFIGNNNAFSTGLGVGQLRCNGGFVEGDVDGDLVADFRIQVFQTDNLLIGADFYL